MSEPTTPTQDPVSPTDDLESDLEPDPVSPTEPDAGTDAEPEAASDEASEPRKQPARSVPSSPRAQLGLALVLMAARFVSPADPGALAWAAGYAAAGAGTGLALTAALQAGPRSWWRAGAGLGALLFQVGLVVGWSEPMDVTSTGPSTPAVLCCIGALIVAVALLRLQVDDNDAVWPARWPGAAAIGALVGYGLTLAGGARLVAFDITEHVSSGTAVDGWLEDLAPVAVVTLLVTPLALGAVAVALADQAPGRSTAAFVGLASLPLAAAGDGSTAILLVGTAILAGLLGAWQGVGRATGITAIVAAGAALATHSSAGPLALLAATLYGAIIGALADVLATNHTPAATPNP